VIGGIVLNQVDPVMAAIEGGQPPLAPRKLIGLPLKVVFLMEVDETDIVQTDRSKDLLGMALSPRGNLQLAAKPGPCGMRVGRLSKNSRTVLRCTFKWLAISPVVRPSRFIRIPWTRRTRRGSFSFCAWRRSSRSLESPDVASRRPARPPGAAIHRPRARSVRA